MVSWLRLHVPCAGNMGSIPGLGTRILHEAWCNQKRNAQSQIIFYIDTQVLVFRVENFKEVKIKLTFMGYLAGAWYYDKLFFPPSVGHLLLIFCLERWAGIIISTLQERKVTFSC